MSNFKDRIVVNRLKNKDLRIEQLIKLNDNQIRKIIDLNGGSIQIRGFYHFNYQEIKKMIELYNYLKDEYEVFLRSCVGIGEKDFKELLIGEDVKNLENALYQKYIDNFIHSYDSKINLEVFSDEFIKENNNIFLIGFLPDDVRERYYNHNLTDKDILENIELFSNIDFLKDGNIVKFISQYGYSDFINIGSQVDLNYLKKILNNYGEKFYVCYNNSEERKKLIDIISKNPNSYMAIVNYIYKDEDFIEDLKIDYRHVKGGNFNLYKETIALLGKENILKYFNENICEDRTKVLLIIYDVIQQIKRENINDVQLNEIFEIISLEVRKNFHYPKSYSAKFIEEHQSYFLPDDAPAELKEKYYDRWLSYEDIKNNLKYFSNTNISLGFENLEMIKRGMFDNSSFIKLLELCQGNLEELNNITFFNGLGLGSNAKNISSYEDFIQKMEDFYSHFPISFNEIKILKKLGFNAQYLSDIEANIKKSGVLQGNLRYRDVRIFTSNIVEKFGFDVINAITEYYLSGAMIPFIDYANDSQLSDKLKNWFIYLNKNNMLDKKILNYSVLSFMECMPLIDDLLTNNQILNNNQVENLKNILINKNKYNVTKVSDLTDYVNYKKNVLSDKFESNNIIDIKDAIIETLFGLSFYEALHLFDFYNLGNPFNLDGRQLYEKYILPSDHMTADVAASIEIIREICSCKDPSILKNNFDSIMKLGSVGITKEKIIDTLRSIYSSIWNQQLFKHDDKKDKISFISGVDSMECPKNVNGKTISSNDKIKVVELDGDPFKLIIHSFRADNTPDMSFHDITSKLLVDPSMWNKIEGATTISTSLISNYHIKTFQEISSYDNNVVFYGFNDLSQDVLRGYCTTDAGTEFGGGKLETDSGANKLSVPNHLISNSIEYRHNEVVLRRKSLKNNSKFDGRIQPNCIICFNGVINDASKLAAQYFDIPIYMINKNKYDSINAHNIEMYKSGKIEKFDNSDIETILLTPGKYEMSKEKLCLELCNKALDEGLISIQQYYERIQYMKDFMEENGMDYYLIKDEINSILENKGEVMEDGITK